MLVTPEDFLEAGRPNTKSVIVEGWKNKEITIRQLTAQTAIDEMRKFDERTGMAKLIIASVINPETGQNVFQDTKEHIALILSLNMEGAVELAGFINDFNGIGRAAVKNASTDSVKTPIPFSATA